MKQPHPRRATAKHVVIEAVEPHRCKACGSTNIQYTVMLRNLENFNPGKDNWAHNTRLDFSCADHLEIVTSIMYRSVGWVKDVEVTNAD